MREQFEAWLESRGYFVQGQRAGHGYRGEVFNTAWLAWQVTHYEIMAKNTALDTVSEQIRVKDNLIELQAEEIRGLKAEIERLIHYAAAGANQLNYRIDALNADNIKLEAAYDSVLKQRDTLEAEVGRLQGKMIVTEEMYNAFKRVTGAEIYIGDFKAGFQAAMLAAAPTPPARNQMLHERNALADAIGNAAIKAGIVRPDVELTGPMLIMLCDNLAEKWASPPAQEDEPVAEVAPWAGGFGVTIKLLAWPPLPIGTKLYTRPQSDSLRAAAEELHQFLIQLKPNMHNWLNENRYRYLIENLRAELEKIS